MATRSWREFTIEDAGYDREWHPEVYAAVISAGVDTCGALADALLKGERFGLNVVDSQPVLAAVEILSADDDAPIVFTRAAEPDASPVCAEPDRCRICGCTEADCSRCIARTGAPCSWASLTNDLCSACAPLLDTDMGIAFPGSVSAWQVIRTKLAAVSVRNVGQVLTLDPAAPPKGIKRAKVEELKALAQKWLDEQLGANPDEPRKEPDTAAVPAPALPSAPHGTTFAMIELSRLTRNPFNPRKTFDEEKLAQLTESVRGKGVLEPVLVRPRNVIASPGRMNGKQGFLLELLDEQNRPVAFALDELYPTREQAEAALPLYELVAGERRFRAATAAKLKTIPAMVRKMSDREAAEVAVVENDQREDVPPLEQAEGYRRLVDLGDHPETIALKIGRPVKYVTARLALTDLIPELQEHVREGKLPFGHAHILARLQPADQRELMGRSLYDWQERAVSLDNLKREIRRSSVHVLSGAPWKWDDADLVPTAGACTKCPKRSGNNRTLFDELLDDGPGKNPPEVCTDGACFRSKREAFVQLQVRKAEETTGTAPLKISTGWNNGGEKDALTKGDYEIVSKKDARNAKPGELKTAVVVAIGHNDESAAQGIGQVVQIRVKKKAAGTSSEDSYKRQQAEQKKKADAGKAAARVANQVVADRISTAVGDVLTERHVALFRHLAGALAEEIGADACREVANRRGIEKGDYQPTRVKKCLPEMETAGELLGFMAELIAARKSFHWGAPYGAGEQSAEQKKFWAAFGVDRAALITGAKAQAKEKKDARVVGKKLLAGTAKKAPAKKARKAVRK